MVVKTEGMYWWLPRRQTPKQVHISHECFRLLGLQYRWIH